MNARVISNRCKIASSGYLLEGFHDDPDILEGGTVTISNLLHLDGSAVTIDLPRFELAPEQKKEIGRWFLITLMRSDLELPFNYYFNGFLVSTEPLATPRVVGKPWRLYDMSIN